LGVREQRGKIERSGYPIIEVERDLVAFAKFDADHPDAMNNAFAVAQRGECCRIGGVGGPDDLGGQFFVGGKVGDSQGRARYPCMCARYFFKTPLIRADWAKYPSF
jgi:hypothetical protein